MKSKSFLNIIKEKVNSYFSRNTDEKLVIGTDGISEDENLFLRFIESKNFSNAQLMLDNDFEVTETVSKLLYKKVLVKMYHIPMFKSLDKKFLKGQFIEKEKDNGESLNQILSFLIKNDLLGLNFLIETQKPESILATKQEVKESIIRDYGLDLEKQKEMLRRGMNGDTSYFRKYIVKNKEKELESNLSKVDNEIRHVIGHFKRLHLDINNRVMNVNSNIFVSPLSFINPLTSEVSSDCNPFLALSNFRTHISLKDICSLSMDERKNEEILKNKFSNLNENQFENIKETLDSPFLTNLFLLVQMSRHIIQHEVEKNGMLPEDLIMKVQELSNSERSAIKGLSVLTVFLYPECIKKIDKNLAIDILEKIKKIYDDNISGNDNRREHSIGDIDYALISLFSTKNYKGEPRPKSNELFLNFWKDLKDDVDGTKLKVNQDENLLQSFLERKRYSIGNIDYLSLAKSLDFDSEMIDILGTIQKVSNDIIKTLLKNSSQESLEYQQYIKSTNQAIFKMIDEYEQVKEIFESKDLINAREMNETYIASLKKNVFEFQKGLKTIMDYIHQENINSLNIHKNVVKKMTR